MRPDPVSGDSRIHPLDLVIGHGKVGPKGWEDVGEVVLVEGGRGTGQGSSLAVESRKVGGHEQDLSPLAQLRESGG